MSNYIQKDDYYYKIRGTRLDQILKDDDSLLDNAEDAAIQVVKDALHSRYDIDTIFSKTGANRDQQVLRWISTIVLYYVYERINDKVVPQRVIDNYDETMEFLKELEKGKRSTQLPRITKEDGKPKSIFRWGSNTKRSH